MTPTLSPTRALVRRERRRQGWSLALAAGSAAGAAASAAALLGLSGWFLTGAALAGAVGPAAVAGFNYLLPSAAIRFLAIARTGLRYTERLAGHSAALKALAEIRPALFAGLAAAPPRRSLRVSSGEATARLVQDVDAIQDLFVRASAPWAALAAASLALLFTGLASPLAAGLFMTAFAAQVGFGAWIGRARSRAPGAAALEAAGALKDRLQAFAAATVELRCFGLTGAVVDHLMGLDRGLGDARRRSWNAGAEMGALQPALTGLTAAGVLALCLHAPPALAALAALTAAIALDGAGGLLLAMDRNGSVDKASERLDEMLDAAGSTKPRRAPRSGEITLRLDHPYCLSPGQRWVLAGPTGCGKTTLLEGLLGLRDLAPGSLMIGGETVVGLDPQAVRALFAYAPQDARMIAGTVRENLALGDPDAGDADMARALAVADLAGKIDALPGGLGGWIGEGGRGLSGGERRRLSLARALLRPAPWLLLDEPTESLDAATEARVIANLAAHLARTGQGLILVSHRPAARALADRMIRLDRAAGVARVDFLADSLR